MAGRGRLPTRAVRLALVAAALAAVSVCSSAGQSPEGVCEAALPGEPEQECKDHNDGEGPLHGLGRETTSVA